MPLPAHRPSPQVGEIRRYELLGSSATYRVLAIDSTHVVVEVVEAPGLAAGLRLRMSQDAVQAMTPAKAAPNSQPSQRLTRSLPA